ncbi:NUDIX domain-containing protein [Kribbia dieselivorans]|uniref:NUDIX domain-containing protein n=1 Tax=Kribbia dieselivorans TaxID=331526 RepID=UPI000839A9B5|nr:NUDIX domain-containing protein [Kribbia dieselivorans]
MNFADLHASAVRELRAWRAPDAAQAALARRYLDHLAAHPDAVAKSGPPVHLTASCLVIDPAGEHVLLTLHAKARRWFQFGGHLEAPDATLAAAAEREAREESGLEAPSALTMLPGPVHLDAHDLPGGFGRCRTHLDVRYAAVAARSATPVVSAESVDVAWWPADELPSGSEELAALVAAARRVLAG